jgi:hypothetical protein
MPGSLHGWCEYMIQSMIVCFAQDEFNKHTEDKSSEWVDRTQTHGFNI